MIKEPNKAFIPKRIFCQFENQKLEAAIAWLAEEMSCKIIRGAPFSPDILALSGFVNIIDRNHANYKNEGLPPDVVLVNTLLKNRTL